MSRKLFYVTGSMGWHLEASVFVPSCLDPHQTCRISDRLEPLPDLDDEHLDIMLFYIIQAI